MAAPITGLEIAQIGLELTRGTAGTPSKILDTEPGGIGLTRENGLIVVRNAGSNATSHRAWTGRDSIMLDMSGNVTYQWLPIWANLALGALGTATGTAANKTWTFGSAVISDTSDGLKSATIEVGGKDTWPGEYRVTGAVLQQLTLSIAQDKPWTYQAKMVGTSIATQAKVAALSPVSTLTDVLGSDTKFYLDTTSAFGSTQRTGSVLSAEITIDTGVTARYTLDGQRNPYRVAMTDPRKVSTKLVVEYASQADYTAAHAGSAIRLRVTTTGPVLGAANYAITLDLPGTYESLVLGNDGNVITEELTLTGIYDTSINSDIALVVVNGDASPIC